MLNQIIQGDCLDILPKIAFEFSNKFIIVTDPPFNIGYNYNSYADNLGADEYYEMLQQVFGDNHSVVIHYPEELYKIAFQIGHFPEKVVSWVYNSNTPKQHRDIAFFNIKPDFSKCGQPYKNPEDKRIQERIANGEQSRLYDWWEVQQVKNVSDDKTEHPCQMPLEVMKRIIAILPEDYIIVDPFAGSGTTGVACKQLKRDFILIEQDNKYVELASTRISSQPQPMF